MTFFKAIGWILWKDLVSELRSRESISSMLFFALAVLLIFSFSFAMDREAVRELIAGVMWVAFGFTGIIGLGKSFTIELQNDCLEALQINPLSKGAIYLGKLLANLLFIVCVELLLLPLFVIFFNLEIVGKLPLLLVIMIGGTLGLSALGTLFSALTAQIRAREVMFPILLLPMAAPVFIGAVEATRAVLAGQPFALYRPWLDLLGIFDLIFIVASFWIIDFVLDN
ncbi:MAG: heme exporter protein CcmB [Nitrospirota bacterium]